MKSRYTTSTPRSGQFRKPGEPPVWSQSPGQGFAPLSYTVKKQTHGSKCYATNLWNLRWLSKHRYYLYGGQKQEDQDQGITDMHVLTMPTFLWTKIRVPTESNNNTYTRSHTCHAIGGQLLVIGGWAPGDYLYPEVDCQRDIINIFNLNIPAVRSPFPVDVLPALNCFYITAGYRFRP